MLGHVMMLAGQLEKIGKEAAMDKLEGQATITVENGEDGTEQLTTEKVVTPYAKAAPAEPLGEVMWGAGITIPTAKFASVRLDCRVTIPAPIGELDAVFDYAVQWVDERLTAKINETKAAYGLD